MVTNRDSANGLYQLDKILFCPVPCFTKGNAMFTWQELKDYIDKMTPEQLAMAVTIHWGVDGCDEFYAAHNAQLNDDQEDDRLDDGHPFITVMNEDN